MQNRTKNIAFFGEIAVILLLVGLFFLQQSRRSSDGYAEKASVATVAALPQTAESDLSCSQETSASLSESAESEKIPAVSAENPTSSVKTFSSSKASSSSKTQRPSSSTNLKKYVVPYTFNDIARQLENQTFSTKLVILKQYFPNGKYWNHAGYDISGLTQSEYCAIVTSVACHHRKGYASTCNHYIGASKKFFRYSDNYQCLGFASMISDLLYGKDAPIRKITDFDAIKPGDEIRFVKAAHSAVVIEKSANSITVLECNYRESGCKIAWGRTIPKSYFKTCGKYFALTRQ